MSNLLMLATWMTLISVIILEAGRWIRSGDARALGDDGTFSYLVLSDFLLFALFIHWFEERAPLEGGLGSGCHLLNAPIKK